MRIQTITTLYDPEEDRIALSVADSGPVLCKLWITRRLLQRLVPALLERLDQQIQAPAGTKPERIEAANVYAQLQARLNRRPVQHVRTQVLTQQSLINKVDIKLDAKGAKTLTFKGIDLPEPAILALNANELRQWLEALKLAANKGQWALDVFPSWVGGTVR